MPYTKMFWSLEKGWGAWFPLTKVRIITPLYNLVSVKHWPAKTLQSLHFSSS